MSLRPTDGHIVAGVKIDENRFVGRMRASQLFQVATDPRRTEDLRQLEGNTQLENVRRIRMEVQRLFEGAKAKNVESYARYIVNVHEGMNGMAPPIILFAEGAFQVADDADGPAFIQIPWDVQLVAIDGETQLAARFEAENINQETKNDFIPVVICHGRPIAWARQVFHDSNNLAVRPNAAIALSMDERDPLTQVAREVAERVAFFKGRVNTVRRQLRGSDKEVVTFAALRGACVTLAEGIAGVKYGVRPVPIDKQRIPEIRVAANEWFNAVTSAIHPALENRAHTVAGASSVMAAIGALGHPLVDIDDANRRSRECRTLIEKLQSVNWEKGKPWEGIAGKFTPKGTFSIAGAKDTSYAVYSALSDPTSSGFRRIRGQVAPTADPNTNDLREAPLTDGSMEARELVAAG